MSDIVLKVDELRSYSEKAICRICHEEEEEIESCKSLEAPCACSGTVKFAHRDCVQRWCNEKGNTVCEICLQKFESGYIVASPKKIKQNDTTVTIRERLEVPRNEEQEENGGESSDTEDYESECAADRSASCCRSVALILTALLLIRHLFVVLTGGEGTYPYSFLTVVIMKASGIVLPMYILVRISAALHNSITHQHHQISDVDSSSEDEEQDYINEIQQQV